MSIKTTKTMPGLYTRLARWWPLLSSPADYREDAALYSQILKEACRRKPKTLLELGSGGGNNASFMKSHFSMTLTDRSEAMLAVSRQLNPECIHRQGDMRSLRLEQRFDAVFIHDAIVYMRTQRDLKRAIKTAFLHCKEGGAAIFVPDYTKETFRGATDHGGEDGEERSMRYLQWEWDPNPVDSQYRIDFVFMFRDAANRVHTETETHICGLFTIPEWYAMIEEAGFKPDSTTLESDELEPGHYRVFIGRK